MQFSKLFLVLSFLLIVSVEFESSRGEGVGETDMKFLTPEEKQLASLINQRRFEEGLQPFVVDSALTEVARKHTEEMVRLNYLNAISPVEGTALDRTQKAWISDYHSIAFVSEETTVDKLYRSFFDNGRCRGEILSEKNTHLGVGIVRGEDRMIATVHLIARVIEFNPVVATLYSVEGANRSELAEETYSGRSQQKYLKFEIYDGTDLNDQRKRKFSQEITVKPDGTFSISFRNTKYWCEGDYYLAVWAKDRKDEEYKVANLLRISPINPESSPKEK